MFCIMVTVITKIIQPTTESKEITLENYISKEKSGYFTQ